ncbi:MAG: caspase family protein [Bacteroidota bacterium]
MLLATAGAYGQEVDLSGEWRGTYSFLGKSYATSFHIKQEGNILTGYSQSLPEDTTKSTIYTVEGTVKGDKVTLFGKEFKKKSGTDCRAKFTMKLLNVADQVVLNGKWGPNLKYGGCPIGASGKVNLHRRNIITPTAEMRATQDATEDEAADDVYTRELVKGLRKRSYHALVIGVDQYQDATINSLDHPVNDGKLLLSVLQSRYAFKKENTYLLENPTRAEILDEFERLSGNLGPNDNLLIFYAGHGYWDEQFEQGYWLPADASEKSKSNWISNATIRDYIRAIDSKHTLLIADACFSGGLLKSRGVGKAMLSIYKMPSRKAITSGTLTEVPDKSVFIKYLIKYLKENEELLLSADQLFYNIKVSVMNNSPNSQVPQYGPIHQANDEGGEFVFVQSEK